MFDIYLDLDLVWLEGPFVAIFSESLCQGG